MTESNDIAPAKRTGKINWLAPLCAALALGAAYWAFQAGRQDTAELAKRLQQQDSKLLESQAQVKVMQDALREAQSRQSLLEGKFNETASQQAQLERQYRALSNDSMDIALADLESVILLAAQQVAAGGSLQGPLIGLQAAETKLERLADPSLVSLKRGLSRDIERLKVLNGQDNSLLIQRLEAMGTQVDKLPLLSDPRQPESARKASADPKQDAKSDIKGDAKVDTKTDGKASSKVDGKADTEEQGFWSRMMDVASGKGRVVGQDWRDLIRVTKIESAEAPLLSPEQSFFVRENLRLRLLNARMALSSRQDALFRSDVEQIRKWLSTYFDRRDKQVQQVQDQLGQMQQARSGGDSNVSFESLAAVRAVRGQRDGKK